MEDINYYYYSFVDQDGVIQHNVVKTKGEFNPMDIVGVTLLKKQYIPIIIYHQEITEDAFHTFLEMTNINS